jgi:hypothetical protein
MLNSTGNEIAWFRRVSKIFSKTKTVVSLKNEIDLIHRKEQLCKLWFLAELALESLG